MNALSLLLYVADQPQLKRTVATTARIASLTQSQITLLAISDRQANQARVEQLITKAKGLLPDQKVSVRIRIGRMQNELLAELHERRYDMLIFGYRQVYRNKRRQANMLVRHILTRAPVDVLVVKGGPERIDKVLICASGAKIGEKAVEVGARFTQALGAEAALLHVTSSVPRMYTGLDEFDETLPKLLDRDTPLAKELRYAAEVMRQHQLPAELRLRHGLVVDEILLEAEAGGYHLIVLGATSSRKLLRKWIMGDVVSQVIDQAPTSVLVTTRARTFAGTTPALEFS